MTKRGRAIGQKICPSPAEIGRGGGTQGWPKLRLSNRGETWGVASFFPGLIGSFTTTGRGLLEEPQGPLLEVAVSCQ